MERVAQQAGKAAPAVAIASALVAAPQASHALAGSATVVSAITHSQGSTGQGSTALTGNPAGTRPAAATLDAAATQAVTVAAAKPARHSAAQSTYYRVRVGDTLSKIAEKFYHNASDWQYLYHENEKTLSDPNVLRAGQRLFIPATVPAHYTLGGYVPRHAKPALRAVSPVSETSRASAPARIGAAVVVQSAAQGTYSCSGLEQLWEQAGGNPADAFMAAEIAKAESDGNPNAISPTADYGLWQINASNGALATLNPLQNAKSAITLSSDGANWGPWTTYHSGAYSGKC